MKAEKCEAANHTKPDIVIAIVGIVVVAVRGTHIVCIVVPRATAQHAMTKYRATPQKISPLIVKG